MVAAMIGAPLIWLALLQTNYVLSYPACGDRSNWWLYAPGAAAALASIALLWRASRWRPAQMSGSARFLAETALMTAMLFVLVVLATLLPPFILQPCD
jgi:hypothetical protein